MNIVKRPIEELRLNPDNPRFIKEDKYKKLLASIREFPQMLDLRPIVVDSEGMVLGGNMRLRACKEAGLKEVPVIYADQLTEEQKREFIIKDNVGFGEWDWDVLANEWDAVVLDAWGLDVPAFDAEKEDETYTQKIEAPNYEPTRTKPKISELYDPTKTDELLAEIDKHQLPSDVKTFLQQAAQRHTVFDYENIAEFYAHAEPEIQELMERSALVIIDFNQAIENGYIQLSEQIMKQFDLDYEQG